MRGQQPADEQLRKLIPRIDPDFKPVLDRLPEDKQLALAAYFLPHGSEKEVLTPSRPRLLKWYCPFAAQCSFPSGHRYCLNVYTGCAHRCEYCYVTGYSYMEAAPKRKFQRLLNRDLADLKAFDVPPAPLHISNSTDPFQPLEKTYRHTRLALEDILEHRHRFTSITILTKNPLLPVEDGYMPLFQALGVPGSEQSRNGHPRFQVHLSLALWREEARATYDPAAPSIESRKEGVQALREAGIPIVLRIDPLFPRSPLPLNSPETLEDFGLVEAQTLDDLEHLVAFAREVDVHHIVYSPAKVVKPRGSSLSPTMAAMRDLYAALSAPSKPEWRGGSWRLPREIADKYVVEPFLQICRRRGVSAKFCMTDLLEIG